MQHQRELIAAFKVSTPVMMGYIVIGFAFGLLFVSFGHDWYLAILMSLLVYAGALQFLSIGMINAKTGFIEIAIASLVVNMRQSFYGLSVLRKFKSTRAFKPYLIFALTDETYALLTSIPEKQGLSSRHYYLFLSLLNQCYWVAGTAIGASTAGLVTFNTQGLEFSLTALFVVLVIEQYKQFRHHWPFTIGVVSALLAFMLAPSERLLISAILISLLMLFSLRYKIGRMLADDSNG